MHDDDAAAAACERELLATIAILPPERRPAFIAGCIAAFKRTCAHDGDTLTEADLGRILREELQKHGFYWAS